ncbi:hypothetical protein PC9H_000050 [Pleurotus ostreatus]|uniref:Uncharacterized protein n=1 Tax=Pleurotus ostreatus TaxID=5322 RepID=A0A8H7DUW4_PLEOS|nr:uncharacterized protein PC9H_000050 [Pleurotus ostreatus]KAF7439714.1 hypothetical protein PC9H_000050 [Pleurotus ostreatus]
MSYTTPLWRVNDNIIEHLRSRILLQSHRPSSTQITINHRDTGLRLRCPDRQNETSGHEIQVEFDCSWGAGATVALHGHNWWCNKPERLFVTRKCAKAFRWMPHRPKLLVLEGDVVIQYTKDKHERSDAVMPSYDVIRELAEGAAYDRDRARILHRYYPGLSVRANAVLEFGDSEDCLRFTRCLSGGWCHEYL